MKLLNDMFTITGGDTDHIQIRLNASHKIYQAHFPGNPITPGVCIVQIITELLEHRENRTLLLDEIVNLKFASTISPVKDETVVVNFTSVEAGEQLCKAKGSIMAGEELKTKFSLAFVYQ